MRKKLSFLSGLAAAALFVFPFATNTYAAETNSLVPTEGTVTEVVYGVYGEVPSDVYADLPADVYGEVPSDVYVDLPGDVYGEVPGDVYGEVPSDVYGEVPSDVYEEVPGDVYGEVPSDVYEEVPGDVYGEVPSDVYEEVPGDVYGEVPGDVYGEVPGDVYGEVPGDVYGEVPGDVYGGVPGDVYDDVTEDVYLSTELVKDGNIVIDNPDNNGFTFTVSQELIDQNVNLIINKGNLGVKLPLSSVKPGTFTFNFTKENVPGSVGSAYHFTFEQNGEPVDFSENPVVLTFDLSGVENWKNLKVYYINAEGKTNEEAKIVSINEQEIVAEVTHFSGYGVFEAASTPAPTDTDNGGTTGNTNNNGGTTGNTNNNGGTTGTTNGNTNTNTNTNGTGTQTDTTNGTTTTTGNALPDTATNSFNLLLAGLMLLAAGGVFAIRTRKVNNN